jgi:hypothetical protein
MDFVAIQRTVKINGVKIPGIIHNFNFFLTDIMIYSDGLIDCWEMSNLKRLNDKIKSNWLVPSIPNGERLSLHNIVI